MANAEYKENIIGTIDIKNDRKIVITHVTIRQSIFFLVLKLLAIETLASVAIIVFHTLILRTDIKQIVDKNILVFNIPLFVVLVIVKTFVMIFVILQWLNEYYEITTKDVVRRKGLLFQKEERYLIQHIGSVTLEQGVFGRIFNFGTLKLFNWTKEKNIYLYLIHNPTKYMNILETLLPEADREKKILREHIINPDDDSV